jgi:hypothetical protein
VAAKNGVDGADDAEMELLSFIGENEGGEEPNG